MNEILLADLRRAAATHFPAAGLLVAYAYGSRVSGRPRPESDLDIGYYPLPGRPGLAIREEGVRIYSSDETLRVDLEAGLLSRHHDYKEVFRRMHEERLAGLAARGSRG